MRSRARAKDVMTRKVVSVAPETPVSRLAPLFARHRISGVPVVDPARGLLGVISRSDLLLRPAPEGACAEEVMTPAVLQASPDAPVGQIAALMRAKRIHRVFVTRGRRLVGVVTALDLLGLLAPARRPA